MFCTKCGSPMPDNAKFCGNCGAMRQTNTAAPVVETEMPNEAYAAEPEAQISNEPVAAQPAFEPPAEPVYSVPVQSGFEAKKGISPAKIGIIAAACVLAVAVIIACFAMSGVFGGSDNVLDAVSKTAEAYSNMGSELDLPDLARLTESLEYSQNFSLWLEELEEMPEIEGFGIRLDSDCSMPERQMDMILTPYYGSVDILDLMLKFDDSELFIGAPALTEDTFYSIDMENLGEELAALGAGDEFTGIGFNMFELTEAMIVYYADSGDAMKAMKDVCDDFMGELEITGKGKETVEVNGYDVKCTAHEVVVSEKAVMLMIDGFEDYLNSVSSPETMIEMYKAMGMPEEVIDELEASFTETDFSDTFSELRYAVEGMDDVTLDVYVSGGYVMRVVWEGEIDGDDAAITVDFGGGKNYVDDLSITLESGGSEMVLASTGNHTGKGGLFTDETMLIIDGETMMTSDLSYDAESDSDNLNWQIGIDTLSIELAGSLTTDEESFALRIDELGFYDDGVSLGLAIGMEYSIGTYDGGEIEIGESVRLSEMTEEELTAAGEKITMNAYSLLFELAAQIPELQELLAGSLA